MMYRRPIAHLLLATCLVASGTEGLAQAITAPLDGIENFTEHGTRDLNVTNPHERCLRIEKHEDFQILQGDEETRRDVNLAESNLNPHQVANIDIPEAGNLLYHVRGVYCDKKKGSAAGEPKKPEKWTATYDRGKARIVLEINGPGEIDNKVQVGENGATLTVRIVGGVQNSTHKITLTAAGQGAPPGMVGLAASVDVPGPSGERTIPLEGIDPGEFKITGTSTGLEPGVVVGEVIAYFVEIEINNSPAKDDDYVQIKSKFPPKRFETPCRARLAGVLPAVPQTVVIVNPDNRVLFSGNESLPLVLPALGGWKGFSISGESESNAVEDVELIAKQGSTEGTPVGSESATVFWFDDANISVTLPPNFGEYGFGRDKNNNEVYTVVIPPAVNFAARARLRPDGANCSAPQIAPLSVAIMQDVWRDRPTVLWDRPLVLWNPLIAKGTTIRIPDLLTGVIAFSDPVVFPINDGLDGAHPLVSKKKNALGDLIGCGDGLQAISSDTPAHPAPSAYSLELKAPDGRWVADILWLRHNATRKTLFSTYAVVYNSTNDDIMALRETEWSLDLDFVAGRNRATVPDADRPASRTPSTGPQVNGLRRNTAITGTHFKNFTKGDGVID